MENYDKSNPFYKNLEYLSQLEFIPYLFLFSGIFFQLSLLSFSENTLEITNIFGRFGHYFSYGLFYLFGRAAYIPGIFLLIASFLFYRKMQVDILQGLVSIPLLMFSLAVALNMGESLIGSIKDGGGVFGSGLAYGIDFVFGNTGKFIITYFVLAYSILSLFAIANISILYSYFKDIMLLKNSSTKVNLPWIKKMTGAHQERRLPEHSIKGSEGLKIKPKENSSKREIPDKNDSYLGVKKKQNNKESIFAGFFDDDNRIYRFNQTPLKTKLKLENTEPEYWKLKLTDRMSSQESPTQKIPGENNFAEDTVDFEEEAIHEVYEQKEKIEEESENAYLSSENEYIDIDTDREINEDINEETIESVDDGLFQNEPRLFPAPVSMVPEVKLRNENYVLTYGKVFKPVLHTNDISSKLEADKVARKIEDVILQYGFESKVVSIEKGPIITRYELTPPPGIKLGRITSLYDELKLYLAVKSIRIVAPIPGRSTIGIEVPNKVRDDVYLSDILKDKHFSKAHKDLTIPLGKDISGKNVFIELNKLPHLLIAGTTGSGKSVSLNAMIAAIIFTKSPEDVRFIMIDPKMVELTLYEDIPHLLMPVITDPKKAARALQWAIQEMEARYVAVSSMKCRDLKSYNDKIENSLHLHNKKKMPYIVIFIDELADLMMVSGKDLEDSITRISQKSRAVGIHLVMATQRPSVDVITGLIKANCPARVAFHVAQKTDSKIILDFNGAETLLGKGDLLYKSPTHAELLRIQAPYISEDEIEKIVEECCKYGAPSYVEFDLDGDENKDDFQEEDEEVFLDAWAVVKTDRKASASYLQRRLRIGYNKAARMMEMMEQRGYVGPQIGTKPREILK